MTVGLVIVSHSTQLAAGVAELAGQMVQGKVPISAAGGAFDDSLGTSADKILAAIQSLDSPDGVLVLLDLGSALLSAEMALEMLGDEQRRHTRLTFAPLVEGAVAAAIEASLGRAISEVQQAAEKVSGREQLQALKPVSEQQEQDASEGAAAISAIAAPPAQMADSGALTVTILLTNPTGLHARPASLFVQTAAKFQATIHAQVQGKTLQANAASIMDVLSLGARRGDTLVLRASGADAEAAITALSELVQADFYETSPTSSAPVPLTADVNVNANASAPRGATSPVPGAPFAESGTAEQEGAWHGVSMSPGVALGPALLYTAGAPSLQSVERRAIAREQVAAEQALLRQSLEVAAQEVLRVAAGLQSKVGKEQAAIFEAHAQMLRDPTLLDDGLQMIEEQRVDAASALAVLGEQRAATLEALDDALLAARAVDVRDAIGQALQHARRQDVTKQDLSALSQPVILIARELTPSDTAHLRPATVLGICTVQGGTTSHSAILARALGIPAMAGLDEEALQVIHSGDEIGLDADQGLLYHQPSSEMRLELALRVAAQQQEQAARRLAAQLAPPPILFDSRHVLLLANIGSEAEAEAARQWNAEGVGLLRTEFLFASASTLPDEEEQRQRYVKVFRAFLGDSQRESGPFVVRTLDAGADKPMPSLASVLGTTVEANPALGVRGIRIHLAHQRLLEQQLGALLRAAAETGIELHIMFPMITTVEELQTARAVFDRVHQRLREQGQPVPARVPVGIMVEVPAAAVMAAELAELADFFSIGANDLMQYTLAVDRTNPALADLYHPMQPSVLRLIAQVAQAGRRAGKPVAVCGEIASDVRIAPILVALGVDELSMTPTALAAVRATLAGWSTEKLAALAEQVLQAKTIADVERLI